MSIKIIYFVHGTTTDNADKICSGWRNAQLNDIGREQAKRLGEINKNIKFDCIFTSDLTRAIESANLAFPNFIKYQDERLRECNYGDFDGKKKNYVIYDEHIMHRFPNGESLIDVENRIKSFIEFLKDNFDGKTIGIVAHRATQLAFEVLTQKITWDEAIRNDWRNSGNWQPGWEYIILNSGKNLTIE